MAGCVFLRLRDMARVEPWITGCRREAVVFYGEVHAEPWSVACELEALKGYNGIGMVGWLGLEMFEYDMQYVLDRWVAGEISWETMVEEYKRQGGEFPLDVYKPLLGYAREAGIPIKGIMLPRRIARIVSREGLGSSRLKSMDLPVDPESVRVDYRWYKENFMALIPRRGPMASLDPERLLEAQALKDEVAGELVYRFFRAHGPGLVVMGWAHVEYNGGVPTRLADRGGEYVVITSRKSLREAEEVASRRGVIASFIAVGASGLDG